MFFMYSVTEQFGDRTESSNSAVMMSMTLEGGGVRAVVDRAFVVEVGRIVDKLEPMLKTVDVDEVVDE